jgi:GNAT superfamily N-acetyltransferase
MAEDRIAIERIRLKDLLAFIDSRGRQGEPGPLIPISRIRAEAFIRIPYASPNEVVLLVGYLKNRCIGYHGLFPGLLLREDGRTARIYWMSTVYVADAFRGRGIAKTFVDSIISLGEDLVAAGVTPVAEKMLKSCGFQNIGEVPYFQLRLERLLLPDFSDRIESFPEPVIEEANGTERYGELKRQCYRMWIDGMPRLPETVSCRRVSKITDSERKDFSGSPCFYRSIDVVNWMLRYPWVCSRDTLGRKDSDGAAHYYFTEQREIFKYFAFEFYGKGAKNPSGYLVLSVSGTGRATTIKILDHATGSAAAGLQAILITLTVARDYLADRVDIPAGLIDAFPHRNSAGFLMKARTRPYYAHPADADSPLAKSIGRLRFQYFDGDTPFT